MLCSEPDLEVMRVRLFRGHKLSRSAECSGQHSLACRFSAVPGGSPSFGEPVENGSLMSWIPHAGEAPLPGSGATWKLAGDALGSGWPVLPVMAQLLSTGPPIGSLLADSDVGKGLPRGIGLPSTTGRRTP